MSSIEDVIEKFKNGQEPTTEDRGVMKAHGLTEYILTRRRISHHLLDIDEKISGIELLKALLELEPSQIDACVLELNESDGGYGEGGSGQLVYYTPEPEDDYDERIKRQLERSRDNESRRRAGLKSQYLALKEMFAQEEADGSI